MQYTWETSKEEEWWSNEAFDTIEECIADAKENHNIKIGATIAVGEVETYEVDVDADSVLEDLEDTVYGEYGECTENWEPTMVKEEEKEKLSKNLTRVVKDWLTEQGEMPKFYKVKSVRTVAVT